MKTLKLKQPNIHIATRIALFEQTQEIRELNEYEQDDLNTLKLAINQGFEWIHGNTMTFLSSEQLKELEK